MEEIDLKRFAKLAWAKKFYIVLIMIIAMVAGYCYSYMYVVPKYKSETTLLVAKIREDLSNENTVKQSDVADFSMTSTLLQPYISLIESKTVLKEVITKENLKITEDELSRMLTVKEENTAMLSITVTHEDAEYAKRVANAIADEFVEKAKDILNIANVNIIDKAEVAKNPYNINHTKDLLIFGMLGVALSCLFIFIVYMLDTTIKEEEDIENEIGLPVLGAIPVFDKKLEKSIKKEERKNGVGKREMPKDSELVIVDNAKSPISEAFRALRTNVTFAQNTKTILVTSSRMSEGKSFITSNLAVSIAKTDKKVIVVDADMRKGRQNKIFRVDNKRGLSNYLANCEETKVDISELCSYIKTTKVPNVHLITCGSRPSNPAELLSPAKLKGLLSVLGEIYDIIIIDGTPSSIIADSVVISRYVDYTMLVTAHKTTKVEDIKKLTKSFEQVGVKINGAVLNKYKLTKEGYTSSYYYNDSNSANKLDDKVERTEIRTVEQFLKEANININSFRYVDTKDDQPINNVGASAFKPFDLSLKGQAVNRGLEIQDNFAGAGKLEYKIEKIDSEITVLKNMIMQIAMNTSQINSKDIELIRYDIRNLKEDLEDIRDNGDVRKLKDEIAEIRHFSEVLVKSQKVNNEKIKKFIDNYYKEIEDISKKTTKTKKADKE